jgi:hypothetical protein
VKFIFYSDSGQIKLFYNGCNFQCHETANSACSKCYEFALMIVRLQIVVFCSPGTLPFLRPIKARLLLLLLLLLLFPLACAECDDSCRSQVLLPFLSVMYFFCHPSPPTILPYSLILSYHLFLGLPLNLVVPKFIYNTLLGILFSSIMPKPM